jgi:16S rRNA (cytidine1402-2'-O)-methyltransferase
MDAPMPGTLYLVASPIGNLEDLTHRAERVLREAAVVACEDTRHSRKLLDHYHIQRPTLSLHRLNEASRLDTILARLRAGEDVALLSDAGAPVLSDPGARLVAAVAGAGLPVVPLPGPSAAVTALMGAGVEEPAVLVGFIPARAGERRRWLLHWAERLGGSAPAPAWVAFEAPHRLAASLGDLEEVLGAACRLTVARELTKQHEEFLRGTVASARAHFAIHPPRGEFTLVIGPAGPPAPAADAQPPAELTRDQLKQWARSQGLARSEAYRRWQQARRGPAPTGLH